VVRLVNITTMDFKVFACLFMIPIVSSDIVHPYSGKDNQVLGVLKPAHYDSAGLSGQFPSYIADLIPEMITASAHIRGYGVIDTLMAYMPFVRKIMAAQSHGKLTAEQEKLITFTEKVVPPMMKFVEGIYGGKSLTDMPLNEVPDYSFTDVMIKLLPDIQAIINELKHKYGGWPGTTKSIEIVNAFMPLARKATQIQAEQEGRYITEEEEKFLTFAEKVVPAALGYSQALFYKNVDSRQEYQITQLIKSAVEDLHKAGHRASTGSYKAPSVGSYNVQRVQPLHSAYRPATSYQQSVI